MAKRKKKEKNIEVQEIEQQIDNRTPIYLGLDVSTSCIGVCIVEDDGSENGKILELTHINPKVPKKMDENEKLYVKKKIFQEFIEKYKGVGITHVIIEEPLMRANNVLTVSILLRFNGMISDCIYNELGIIPQYISSYDARKYSFPDLMGIRKYGSDEMQYEYPKIYKAIKECRVVLFGTYPWSIDKKSIMQQRVSEIFPNISWLYNKKGELKKENFDATDAYVCVLGFMNKKKYGDLKFSSQIIKESKNKKGIVTIDYYVRYWDREEKRKTYIDSTVVNKKVEHKNEEESETLD